MLAIFALSCQSGASSGSKSGSTESLDGKAKYVFFFIGDGMAASQVRLAEAALTVPKFQQNFSALTSLDKKIEGLNIKEMPITGLATTNAENRYITCSAAAATALATGSKTDIGMISQSPNGEALSTMAEKAKKSGMKVGIVSSVSIDHATPACFYSHSDSRNNYASISDQLLKSGFDYFGGGSVKIDSRANAEGVDKAAAFASYKDQAEQKGYKYVTTRAEFDAVKSGETKPVIATINMLANEQYSGDGFSLPFTIDLAKHKADDRISLAEFTQKGIDVLENDKGFFMMVEGGKIDWACHANDAATCAYEVVAFDQAVGVALDFAAKHPKETLIVITGDHDCGGLTIGFAGTGYESAFDILSNSNTSYVEFAEAATKMIKSGESFDKLLAYACKEFGFKNDITDGSDGVMTQTEELSDYDVKRLKTAYQKSKDRINNVKTDLNDQYKASYGSYDPFTVTCTHILNNKAGIDFSSYSHTAVPVMVFAKGANERIFGGYYDNTDIAKKIMMAAGIE